MRIALAGNPNSGKTTLFNALTGSSQYVGNWPGVTVEKKEGKLRKYSDITIVDLPGIYSLSPYTLEEVVARNFLIKDRPDAILNIVDGTNLERNLYLTTQLVELGIPVVVAVNLMDVVRKNGDKINTKELSRELGCSVVEISALKGDGIDDAVQAVLQASGKDSIPQHTFSGPVEHALAHIEESALHNMPESMQRWYAIKIFERDSKVLAELSLDTNILSHIESDIAAAENELDDDAESIITNERYIYIAELVKNCYRKNRKEGLSISDKIDRVVTNRWLGLPIFALVMFLVYYVSVSTVGTWVTDWTNDVFVGEWIMGGLSSLFEGWGVAPWLQGLVVDGIVGGVGAILGFVPQMLVLFLFLAFLESCGYMARVAFVLDRIFRKFGLSGKSFIPMLIGTGCGVPGVMASRTIESERDRRMTIMTTTFIPCGAKLPIIALIAGAIFSGAWWVAPSAYFIGIAAIIISGIILKKTTMFSGDPSPFVMEMPAYHWPSFSVVLKSMWERGSSFIKKAGTIILLSSVVLWFLQAFGFENGFRMVEDLDNSLLAYLGKAIAWMFIPLGFGSWQSAVATITGLIAKENVVGTMGILYGFAEASENGIEFWAQLALNFTPAAAYSFLVFNLLSAPCFAAIGAIKREMNSSRWTWFAIGYQTVFAYSVSLIVYQVWAMIAGYGNVFGFIVALVLLAFGLYLLFRRGDKRSVPYRFAVDSAK